MGIGRLSICGALLVTIAVVRCGATEMMGSRAKTSGGEVAKKEEPQGATAIEVAAEKKLANGAELASAGDQNVVMEPIGPLEVMPGGDNQFCRNHPSMQPGVGVAPDGSWGWWTYDSPPRAYIDGGGGTNLNVGHWTTFKFHGSGFNSLTARCDQRPVLQSTFYGDPAGFNASDGLWMWSTWIGHGGDRNKVMAFLHHEYNPDNPWRKDGQGRWFPHQRPGRFFSTIKYAQSHDSGFSFGLSPGYVSAFGGHESRNNLVEPTNLVRRGGFYYMMRNYASAHSGRALMPDGSGAVDKHGYPIYISNACLMRSTTPDVTTGWFYLAHDGSWQNANQAHNPAALDCKPIFPIGSHNVHSLTFNTYLNKYMALFQMDIGQGSQFGFSVSDDLLSWSRPRAFFNGSFWPTEANGRRTPYTIYPSLIDHMPDGTRDPQFAGTSEEDLNFARANQEFYVYHIQYDGGNGRAIVRQKFRVAKGSFVAAGSLAYQADYYRMMNEDLQGSDDDLRRHWLFHGIKEGRRASPAFDLEYYKYRNEDLVRAFGANNEAYLEHWLRYGIDEGRPASTAYDADLYTVMNDGLAAAVGGTRLGLQRHWAESGIREGRVASYAYDNEIYATLYWDLANAIRDQRRLLFHWLKYGQNEAHVTTLALEPEYYAYAAPDIFRAAGNSHRNMIWHWLKYGIPAGDIASLLYDGALYQTSYPELARALGYDQRLLLRHWVKYGQREGHRTSLAYDHVLYSYGYPQLARDLGGDARRLLIHWLKYGHREGHRTSVAYDPSYYPYKNTDLASIANNPRLLLFHWIRHGSREGREASLAFSNETYRYANGDLAPGLGSNPRSELIHFLAYGIEEARKATLSYQFGPYYLANPDLNPGSLTRRVLLYHWYVHGINEGRIASPLVEPGYYRAQNRDLGNPDTRTLAYHWAAHGVNEGRKSSSRYDGVYYKSQHADLRAAIGAPLRPYALHYMTYGQNEGRRAFP